MNRILLTIAFAFLATAAEDRVELTITGGHDTDPRDHGRPVSLIAGALNVTPEVFRSAFSHVTPAPAGSEPDPAQVRQNKAALLGALARYGVTNDLLDQVSNYYRYNPGRGEMWPTVSATAYVTIKDGEVTSLLITNPGSGYSSPPKISIPNRPEVPIEATLLFDRNLKKNGSLASIARKGQPRP